MIAIMKYFTFLLALFTGVIFGAEESVETILANRIDTAKKTMGMVIGTIDASGSKVTGYGRLSADRAQKPDGDTLFEIGSITKVFTSLVLADMIERGEVKADDPVKKFLPETVKLPSRNGREITLLDLSMQISGLPRMPANMRPADASNPYADYTEEQMYSFLSGYQLTRDPGEKYEYSNLAVGLLGHVLARKAGMSYEKLVRTRVLEPLGMRSTYIEVPESEKKRFATGHNAMLAPVKYWDLPTFTGAGALRSTANDMLRFLAANMELVDTPLKPAMRRMRAVRKATGIADMEIMMGWHVLTAFDSTLVWHNGGTGGFHSFAGFDPVNKKGVIVLSNSTADIDDIGRHLVVGEYRLKMLDPAVVRKEIVVDAKILQSYAGVYAITPAFGITVTADGARVFGQATGQERFEMFAESETEFFLKVAGAQVRFTKDEFGKIGIVLIQNGRELSGRRAP
jgi:D-alanyl-D-alanine-carboxypeptidase/D-alanyl-D-alanine-endopeptidase